MATYNTPKRGVAFKMYVGLVDQSNTKLLKANPTIASGDFQISKDGGAFANLATLPSANPASGRAVMIDLSASEMTADNVVIQCVDAAGAEWCDQMIELATTAAQLDDLATAANLATVASYIDTEIGTLQTSVNDLPTNAELATALGAIPTADENADALLGRNVSGGSSSGRLVKQAFHFIRNRWVVAAGTLSVYDTDDTTSSWTAAVTGTAGADPVTGSDPA